MEASYFRVGNSESKTLQINELLGESYSAEYYTVRVYGASRSCNLASSFCSNFIWKTSAQKALDYESTLNNVLTISSDSITTSSQVNWEDDSIAVFQYGGFFTVSVPQTDFYRVSFDILVDDGESSSSAELCLLLNGVNTMSSIPLRSDMAMKSGWISDSCSSPQGNASIRLLSTGNDQRSVFYCVGIELLSPNNGGEGISIVPSINLMDGATHHVEINIHLLYHYLTIFLDNQDVPTFALDSV